MKVKIPAKFIEVCDLCKRDAGVLTECAVCDRAYCHICKAISCIHQPSICKECGAKPKVKAVVEKCVPKLQAILIQRDADMRRAGKQSEKGSSDAKD